VPKTFTVTWDYAAFPVWSGPDNTSGMDATRAIKPELRHELQDWCDRVSSAMWGPDGPEAPGWDGPGDEVVGALDTEGRALADRLQEALGPTSVVEYLPI
jgi:hypothetical protein